MKKLLTFAKQFFFYSTCLLLVSCAHYQDEDYYNSASNTPQNTPNNRFQDPNSDLPAYQHNLNYDHEDFTSRMPAHENTGGKKLVLVDPNVHAWGAYGTDGNLIRAGIATAGGAVCPPDADEDDCRTKSGTFHILSMRGEECISKKYPRPKGGGLMPYCMYFNNGQALHGSPDDIVVENNVSHGCVRMRIPDAQWMWSNFAGIGTTVKVVPYTS
ncbi:MAG: L,D-transpeptidase [Pseudomonadota bacterium]